MAASMGTCARRAISSSHTSFVRLCSGSTSAQHGKERQGEVSPHKNESTPSTFKIPRKIKRSPTAILEALASTVNRDPTAAHYMYMDDPFLIPKSMMEKKSNALSKAAGRKAAQHVIQNHPHLFKNPVADPFVEALTPKSATYKHCDVSEEALEERISRRNVSDAGEVYKRLKNEGVKLNSDTHFRLLELLCVYNSENPPPVSKLYPEEYHHRKEIGFDRRLVIQNTWKNNGLAEMVFDDIEDKTPECYCCLIRGMAKHYSLEKATQYYKQMKKDNMPVDIQTYNALLSCYVWCRDKEGWSLITATLEDMQKSGTRPNLATFNAVFLCLGRMKRYWKVPEYAAQTLVEMKNCGIEPSLATYSNMLQVFFTAQDAQSPMLGQILNFLEGKEFTLRDPDDLNFFTTAMAKCYHSSRDLALARKLDDIVNTGSNNLLMGDSFNQSLYYSLFFQLCCLFEDMDTIMELYEKITPNLWSPSYQGIEELFRAIELHEGYKYLPRIWSDLHLLDEIKKPRVLGPFLDLMVKAPKEEELSQQLADMVTVVMDRWKLDYESDSRSIIELSAEMLSLMIQVSLTANKLDQAWSLFDMYKTHGQRHFSGLMSEKTLTLMVDSYIESNDAEKAIAVVARMKEMDSLLAEDVVEKIKTNMSSLSDSQKITLEEML